MQTLGVITARKNSRRCPGKNKRLLGNKPLICWTIDAALESKLDHIVIISDDWELYEILHDRYGTKFFFVLEPPEFGEDDKHIEAILYGINQLISNIFIENDDLHVVLLQPTSPFRNEHHIDYFIDIYTSAHNVYPLASVNPYWIPSGSIYVISYALLKNMKSFYGPKTKYVPMRKWDSYDIDHEWQFKEAERYVERILKNV